MLNSRKRLQRRRNAAKSVDKARTLLDPYGVRIEIKETDQHWVAKINDRAIAHWWPCTFEICVIGRDDRTAFNWQGFVNCVLSNLPTREGGHSC